MGKGMDNEGACGHGGRFKSNCIDFEATSLPLSDALHALGVPQRIDYFSLDIEGAEYLAMRSFPWNTHRFTVLTVERPKERLEMLLKDNKYTYLCDNGSFGDQMWVDMTFLNSTAVGALDIEKGPTKSGNANSMRCDMRLYDTIGQTKLNEKVQYLRELQVQGASAKEN